ncbi:MAG: hypothetical protein L3J21_00540 [Devosiaceae bacterium]|nr:hypothetical protein [Devosiaceae bacterium]
MKTYFRPERIAIRIDGPDAKKLLNDVVTGTVSTEPNIANWWALLSPQGKIQAEGLIGWCKDAYFLDISTQEKQQFLRKMNMFKLRADAQITDLSETHRVGWSEHSAANETRIEHLDARNKHIADPEKNLGFRVITKNAATRDWIEDGGEFLSRRINLGISQLGEDYAPDSLFPHDIGMDLLNGIDFSKGCYVGQEVVSRMRHRGTTRKRPLIASFSEANLKSITSGEEILLDGKKIGIAGRVVKGKAIAIARLDRLSAATAGSAQIGGLSVTLATPSWASYDFTLDSKK